MTTITTTAPSRHHWAAVVIAVLAATVVALTISLIATLTAGDNGGSRPTPNRMQYTYNDPCYDALRGAC